MDDDDDDDVIEMIFITQCRRYHNILYESPVWVEQTRKDLRFIHLKENDCWDLLRFRQNHLVSIFEVIRMPDVIRLDDGSLPNGEE